MTRFMAGLYHLDTTTKVSLHFTHEKNNDNDCNDDEDHFYKRFSKKVYIQIIQFIPPIYFITISQNSTSQSIKFLSR